jgi:hypothetical protein
VNVSWWQEALQILAVLGSWQIVLILIVILLVAILVAIGIVYLMSRFVLKDQTMSRFTLKGQIWDLNVIGLLSNRIKKSASNQNGIIASEGTSLPNFPEIHPLDKISNVIPQRNTTITAIDSNSYIPVSSIPSITNKFNPTSEVESYLWAADLIAELDHNLRVINEFNGTKLPPLQNRAWLAHLFSSNKFAIDLEYQLEQVYHDISLWNNMLWISTELSHQTDFSNKRYQESLFNISERLKNIRQIIK